MSRKRHQMVIIECVRRKIAFDIVEKWHYRTAKDGNDAKGTKERG